MNKDGKMTGDNIAFIYPDLVTALVGRFDDGMMINAQPAMLEKVDISGCIAQPTFRIIGNIDQTVGYSFSSETYPGDKPLIPDPYERRTCQVKSSELLIKVWK